MQDRETDHTAHAHNAQARTAAQAITEDFQEVAGRVGATLLARGARPEEAEECAQVAMVEGYVRSAEIRDPVHIVTYVTTIALRHWWALREAEDLTCPVDLESTAWAAMGTDDPMLRAVHGDTIDALGGMVSSLTERDRDILAGWCLRGETSEEIARRHGLKARSVRQLIYLLRLRLRGALASDGHEVACHN